MPERTVIGVDAGGTKLLGGVVGDDLVVRSRVHRLWRGGDRSEVLDIMVDAVEEARAAAGGVDAVGFGIPSLLDRERGESVSSVHLPLDDVPFREIMAERTGLPVIVDNDANAAVLAEQRYGAAQGADDVLMLTLGTGVGGGIVLGGEVYRGSTGSAGELGHVTVDVNGPPCGPGCPANGCLESLVSGTALARDGLESAQRERGSALGRALAQGVPITGALVTELAHDGDEAARAVVERAGRYLGVGLAGLVNVFNPEVVVIGGGVVAAGDLLLDPARRTLRERGLRPSRDVVRVVPARFGDESGMIGAAVMALEADAP